jgi:hypothetical protein
MRIKYAIKPIVALWVMTPVVTSTSEKRISSIFRVEGEDGNFPPER